MDYVFYKEPTGKEIVTEKVREKDIERISDAAVDVMRVYRVEEIFHMMMSALKEFNTAVFVKADQERFEHPNVVENELFRMRVNSCAATFLTSVEMYMWYLKPDKESPPFAIKNEKFNDERFVFCKALRNYMQHVSTVGVNISWGGGKFACGETMASISVSADTIDMKANKDALRSSSWEKLNNLIKGKREIDLYEIFNGVADVLYDIHKDVRASKEYATDFKKSSRFLSRLHKRLIKRGFFFYRYEGDDENECRGQVPYLYDRQIEMISYMNKRYTGVHWTDRFYTTMAPQEMIRRASEADKIVSGYVRNNGVVADFDNGTRKITSSVFTTKKMRDWYLRDENSKAVKGL